MEALSARGEPQVWAWRQLIPQVQGPGVTLRRCRL